MPDAMLGKMLEGFKLAFGEPTDDENRVEQANQFVTSLEEMQKAQDAPPEPPEPDPKEDTPPEPIHFWFRKRWG